MMDRRTFVSTAAGALLVKALPANAQPAKKVPRIGVLVAGAPATASHLTAAFTEGLREHGYVDGQTVVVERRFADNRAERMSEMAIIWNPDLRGAVFEYKETASAARALRLQLQAVEVSRADDFDRAFSALTTGLAEALIVVPSPLTFANRSQITSLAQRHRLPTLYGQREYVDAGGLIAYGSNLADAWRRAATFVDKILKGAKPGELPIEQPTKFELVINQKTAKALGLTIPPSLLRRADEVIQ